MDTKKEQYDVNLEVAYDPLTDWSNEPKVTDLKSDFQAAQSHHSDHTNKVQEWLDNLNVSGNAKVKKKAGRSSVTPKLIRKQAEWRYAALSEAFLSNSDIFKTSPYTWEDKDRAIQAGLVLNFQWNTKIDKVRFIDEYVRTAVDEGTVLVRTGWEFKEEEREVPNMVTKPVTHPQQAQILIEAATAAQQDSSTLDQLPPDIRDDVVATIEAGEPMQVIQDGTKTELVTVKNHPTAEVVDYDAGIVDPSCKGDIEKANFVIYAFETSRSDLEKEGDTYSNLDQINVENSAINTVGLSDHQDEVHGFNFKDDARKRFIAYEYWGYWDIDGSGKTQPIVATWVGNVMIRLEKSPYPDEGLPFVLVHYLPKRKHVYGEPDGELLTENQQIVGAVTRGMLDIMGRSAVGQVGVRRGALDVTNQRKFDAGADYVFNNNVDPSTAFFTHKYPELPQSAPFMLELQNQEAEALTGVKAFHGGISGEGLGRSATAARSAMDAAGKRETGILRRLAQGMIQIGRKHMAMNALFLDEEEVVRVTNDEFIRVKREDLAAKADITLDISTAEADQAKAEEISFMLQTLGNNIPFEMTQMLMSDIARLRKMPKLAHKLEGYQPQPDPLEEERKKLELLELQAKIAKLESEAAENQAEAQESLAKAREADSKTDLNNLDFVEEESGVKQARDLEMQGAQAQANLERDIVKESMKQQPGANGSTNPDGGNTF